MGSEDFSRVLAEVPGAFVFLGACVGDDPEHAPTNHSALARFDESVLPDAALLLAELARRRLDAAQSSRRHQDGQSDDGRAQHDQHAGVEGLAPHLQQPSLPAG